MLKVADDFLLEMIKNFNQNENSLREYVEIIMKWMKDQPHFPETLDERSVQNFLILNKFSVEKCKPKIDFYYTAKSVLEEFFTDLNPKLPHMKKFREINSVLPHPQLFNNSRVFFVRLTNKQLVDKLEPLNAIKHFICIQEMRMRVDVMFGDILIIDCTDFPLSHYLKFTPSLLYKCLVLLYQKLCGNRLTAVYLTNFPPIGQSILEKVAKPKIFGRIHILPKNEDLLQYFPEEYLPPEFGGKGTSTSILQELFEDELKNHQELFDHLDKIRVNENRRPAPSKNDEILGYYGNFKKIDID